MDKRLLLVRYLENFIGSVYKWGGSGPYNVGFDCSGFILEGLMRMGLWGNTDTTSQGIYNHFSPTSKKLLPSKIKPGCLLFFGKDTKSITHIALSLDHVDMIEAGGGDSKTIDKGMVRIRPVKWRKDLVAVLDIFND